MVCASLSDSRWHLDYLTLRLCCIGPHVVRVIRPPSCLLRSHTKRPSAHTHTEASKTHFTTMTKEMPAPTRKRRRLGLRTMTKVENGAPPNGCWKPWKPWEGQVLLDWLLTLLVRTGERLLCGLGMYILTSFIPEQGHELASTCLVVALYLNETMPMCN